MSNYDQNQFFQPKDDLPAGDTEKIILGADVDAELNDISVMSYTKIDKPSEPEEGDHLVYTSGVWSAVADPAALTAGFILPFPGENEPTGWAFCDGRELSQSVYTALYAVCQNNYDTGGETANHFRIPDLRGRQITGVDNMGTAQGAASRLTNVTYDTGTGNEGSAGGDDTTAGVAEHSHAAGTLALGSGAISGTYADADNSGDSHVRSAGGASTGNVDPQLITLSGASLTGSTANAGTASPGPESMNPFLLMNWIIKLFD